MRAGRLVGVVNIGRWHVAGTEEVLIGRGVAVAHAVIGEEAHRLVVTHRPAHLLFHIGFDELRTPVPVIAGDQPADRNVMEQAGQHDLLGLPGPARQSGALEQVVDRSLGEAVTEEIQETGLLRHFRQPRVVAHHHAAAFAQRFEHLVFAVVVGLSQRYQSGVDHHPGLAIHLDVVMSLTRQLGHGVPAPSVEVPRSGSARGAPRPCRCIAGNSKSDDPELELLEFRDNPAGTGPGDGPDPGEPNQALACGPIRSNKDPHIDLALGNSWSKPLRPPSDPIWARPISLTSPWRSRSGPRCTPIAAGWGCWPATPRGPARIWNCPSSSCP